MGSLLKPRSILPPSTSPAPSEEPQELLEDNKDESHYFLQRGNSQKRRKSVRLNSFMASVQPLSPTEVEGETSPSSPFPPAPPSSPTNVKLRRRASLSIHAHAHSALNMVKFDMMNFQRPSRSPVRVAVVDPFQQKVSPSSPFFPDVMHQLSNSEKNVLRLDLATQMALSQKMKRGDGKSPISKQHFRPVPFQTKADIDNFFGQTKGQKRQLALRTKDEDGRIWFDRIEQEEFAKLLSSTPSSPMTDYSKTDSSTYSPCLSSPTFGRCRQSSIVAFDDHLTALRMMEGEDVACFTYLPLSSFQVQPCLQGGINCSFPSIKPEERRRKRSPSDLYRGNFVQDYEIFMSESYKDMEQEEFEGPKSITMPAFLPLRRHQHNTAFLDEAFAGGIGEDKKDNSEEYRPTALTSRTISRGGKRPPQNLQLASTNFDNISSSHRPKQRASVNLTPITTKFNAGNGPFDEYRVQRRGSSFDLGHLSSPHFTRLQQGDASSPSSYPDSPVFDPSLQRKMSNGKAATILGKDYRNENLLAPGGLSTGEHVYDGVDIPCRSVHLQSDDEDEDTVKPKNAFTNVKAWLKAKTGSVIQQGK